MIEEEFYATIKLKTGEEIFCKAMPTEEENELLLLVVNPVIIGEIKNRSGDIMGYKIEPWLKTTTEDLFIVNMNDVLTMAESNDVEMISVYQSFVRKNSNVKHNKPTLSRKMGYLANVNDAKELLEKIFKNS